MDLALFDFDGTITDRGAFPEFLTYAVRPLRKVVWGLLLSPVIIAYRLGRAPSSGLRETFARCGFAGERTPRVEALGERFAAEILPKLVRPLALDRIAWHKARGDRIVVVSASLDLYLAPWCRALDIELICTRMDVKDGRFTGHYLDGDCCGAEKSRRILAHCDLSQYETIYAYGDTDEDREMLAMAHKRYFRWQEVRG